MEDLPEELNEQKIAVKFLDFSTNSTKQLFAIFESL